MRRNSGYIQITAFALYSACREEGVYISITALAAHTWEEGVDTFNKQPLLCTLHVGKKECMQ